jgi:hypothetical protein
MHRIVVLGFLVLAVGCAPLKYPAATWQRAQQQRLTQGIVQLEWDGSLFPAVSERAQELAGTYGGIPPSYTVGESVGVYPWGENGVLCELVGKQPTWGADDTIAGLWMSNDQGRTCILGAEYHHAAIAAYVGPDGSVYEVMWITN